MIAALDVSRSGALYFWNGVELRSVLMCITNSESPFTIIVRLSY